MKICAILDNSPSDGGGFNQGINAIKNLTIACDDNHDIEILVTSRDSHNKLKVIGLNSEIYKLGLLDKLYNILARTLIFNILISRFKLKSKFEKNLNVLGYNLAYFVTPSALACSLQNLNYIYTLWDLSYKVNVEFPEVREFGKNFIRDSIYRVALPKALLVITAHSKLSDLVSTYFSVDPERIISAPLEASPFLELNEVDRVSEKILKFEREEYFFYPAQYWSHKNHIRIFQALNHIKESTGSCPALVLSGDDKGNLKHLKEYVAKHELDESVTFFKFLDYFDFNFLYRHAHVIVMPTYFGPNNVVPLEAWKLKKPLIYSLGLEIESTAGALLVNPDDYKDLANAILEVRDIQVRKKLIHQGQKALERHEKVVELQKIELKHRIELFEKRFESWSN